MKRTEAPGNVDNLYVDRNIQMGTAGTTLMAEDRNNIQEEICNPILTGGAALDGNDQHQLEKSIIALSRQVGELILTDVKLTPKGYAGATGEDYCPVIPRHDADHDIDDTVVPQSIIDKLNNVKWNLSGVEDFNCTVSGTSIIVESSSIGNALVAALVHQGMVNRWYNSGESQDYENDGALYSGSRAFCLTIASVNYEITNVNAISNTITVSEEPGDGSKVFSIYPHRIGGQQKKARFRRISGEVLTSSGDISNQILIAGHLMDCLQNHRHTPIAISYTAQRLAGDSSSTEHNWVTWLPNTSYTLFSTGGAESYNAGPIRTGKNTNPRAYGVNVYTHLRYLLSTNWTSN